MLTRGHASLVFVFAAAGWLTACPSATPNDGAVPTDGSTASDMGTGRDVRVPGFDAQDVVPPDPTWPDVPQLCEASVGPASADVPTVGTAGPGGSLVLGAACDPANNQCGTGTLCCRPCCLANAPAVCTTPDPSGACPLPDVTIDPDVLRRSIRIDYRDVEPGSCEIAEGSVNAPGRRRLMYFSIRIPNYGTADMHLGPPERSNPNFNFMNCHGHVHYEGYGQYRLIRPDGCVAATGHKSGFCVMDLLNVTPGATARHYGCGDMGVSVGWADEYGAGTSGQWVDITDVEPGEYLLEATVNPEYNIPESNFANNSVRIRVTIPPEGGLPDAGLADARPPRDGGPPGTLTGECVPGPGMGADRDCDWIVEGDHNCTPGEAVVVGCNDACSPAVGSCTGNPVLRVCVGPSNPCTNSIALGSSDNTCGNYCPLARVMCPPTGRLTVLTASYNEGRPYVCNVSVGPAP
jgi:hypothetical protein